jgi:hypothetical protein
MGSTLAIGRWGVKTRAFVKFGETVATFLGSESLGRALAIESKKKKKVKINKMQFD